VGCEGVRMLFSPFKKMTTPDCLKKVKLAKFQTFLSHVINKHKDLPNKIFNKCYHGAIETPKLWMLKSKE